MVRVRQVTDAIDGLKGIVPATMPRRMAKQAVK